MSETSQRMLSAAVSDLSARVEALAMRDSDDIAVDDASSSRMEGRPLDPAIFTDVGAR